MDFEVEFNEEEVAAFIDRSISVRNRAVELTAADIWGMSKEESPVDHGRLAGSHQLEQVDDLTWRIFTNVLYALWVHEGTGIFGPEGMPITPVSASVLVFEVDGEMIFARQVSGRPPDPFYDRAMNRAAARTDDYVAAALTEMG